MKLGVCYYPEHWPEEWWADDARAMTEMGISWVRIGEFAWSRIEPEPGRFDWGWLDRAIETLHAEGLRIVLGTPTATPPKWLVDRDPSMLAVDRDGRPRKFGSRRHYCFSSESYRAECARIVTAIAERYGKHPGVGAWQTDNEYGCHDTTLSYSDAAARRFRSWLARRYNDIASLNRAWGGVFWSQEYRSFDEVDPPNLAVTEVNPSHQLDYNRFASDEVVSFNKLQVDILRKLSPGRDIIHNFMGFYTGFDHHEVGRDLDIAAWDSYPLGFLEQFWSTAAEKARYLRQGHPDIAAFHHDLYRGCAARPLVGDGATAGAGELGELQPSAPPRHGACLDLGSIRARRGGGFLFPLAASAVCAGTDARRIATPGPQRRYRRRRSTAGRQGNRRVWTIEALREGEGRTCLRLRVGLDDAEFSRRDAAIAHCAPRLRCTARYARSAWMSMSSRPLPI